MKIAKVILNGLLTAALIFMSVIAAVSFFSSPNGKGLLGYKGYTVISGSMEPEISAGDFVFVKMEPFEEIQANDVITFQTTDQVIVTHRVNRLTEGKIETKGDANNAVDAELVPSERLIGRVAWIIPYLGSLLIFLQKPIVVIVLTTLVIIWLLFAYYVSGREEEKAREKEQKS